MKRFILILIVMMCSASVTIHAESKQGTATKTEQVTNQATDKNPIVGTDKKGRTIHQGAKGGLYYWTTPKSGKRAGQPTKRYLTKADKEEFYRDHPNVKRPTNN